MAITNYNTDMVREMIYKSGSNWSGPKSYLWKVSLDFGPEINWISCFMDCKVHLYFILYYSQCICTVYNALNNVWSDCQTAISILYNAQEVSPFKLNPAAKRNLCDTSCSIIVFDCKTLKLLLM